MKIFEVKGRKGGKERNLYKTIYQTQTVGQIRAKVQPTYDCIL